MVTFSNFIKALKDPIRALLFLFGIKRHFSQNGEDLILEFLTKKENGFYIDIGANNPINGSNTYWFYRLKNWNGICIEPNKKLSKLIRSKRPRDIVLQKGLGKLNGEINFYEFDADQLSTCDADTAKRYVELGYKITGNYSVPIMTLKDVCDQYLPKGTEIDILSVDVEGWDMDVLESNDWNRYRPNFIVLETVQYGEGSNHVWSKQNSIFDPYLKNKGYSVVAETGVNTIYKKDF